MDDQFFNTFCGFYWPVYFMIGVSLNLLLYWLILTKTTKVFKFMKYFLILSNTANMSLTIIAFFFQGRLIYNSQSMAVMGQGVCKYVEPVACVYSYNLILVILSVVILMNLHTLHYRMVSINNRDRLEVIRKVAEFSLHYLFSFGSLILSHLRTGDISTSSMNIVYNKTLIEHPNYHLHIYNNFGGFRDLHSVWNKIMTYSYLLIACYAPIFGFYCRYKTLHVLDLRINSLSEKTISQFKSVVHGLTIQVALPLVCYVPAALLNTYNQVYYQDPIIFAQYTLTILVTIPALVDPILNIYYIIPYRNALKRIFRFQVIWEASRVQGAGPSTTPNQ